MVYKFLLELARRQAEEQSQREGLQDVTKIRRRQLRAAL